MAHTFIEDAISFPNGWSAKGEMKRIPYDENLSDALHEWRKSTFDAEDYYEAIFMKFSEMLDKYGINLSVHDGENNFSSTEKKIKDYSSESLDRKNQKSFKEVEEIANKCGLTYNQVIEFWTDMNKQWNNTKTKTNKIE